MPVILAPAAGETNRLCGLAISRLHSRRPIRGDTFTGFYAWYNDPHPLTTLAMLTPNQIHTGQRAAILTARQVRQAQTLDLRRHAGHAPFTLEELIGKPVPDVSVCPVCSPGTNAVSQNTRHPWRN